MNQKTLVELTTRYPVYISIHATVLKSVTLNLTSLDIIRSSKALLNVLDKVINQTVAKVMCNSYPLNAFNVFVYITATVYVLYANQREV